MMTQQQHCNIGKTFSENLNVNYSKFYNEFGFQFIFVAISKRRKVYIKIDLLTTR